MDTPTDYFLSMTASQDVRIPTNGEQLAAYVYRPDVTEPPRPCIVMAHGFSATRDDGLPGYAEAFRDDGYVVSPSRESATTSQPRNASTARERPSAGMRCVKNSVCRPVTSPDQPCRVEAAGSARRDLRRLPLPHITYLGV